MSVDEARVSLLHQLAPYPSLSERDGASSSKEEEKGEAIKSFTNDLETQLVSDPSLPITVRTVSSSLCLI